MHINTDKHKVNSLKHSLMNLMFHSLVGATQTQSYIILYFEVIVCCTRVNALLHPI